MRFSNSSNTLNLPVPLFHINVRWRILWLHFCFDLLNLWFSAMFYENLFQLQVVGWRLCPFYRFDPPKIYQSVWNKMELHKVSWDLSIYIDPPHRSTIVINLVRLDTNLYWPLFSQIYPYGYQCMGLLLHHKCLQCELKLPVILERKLHSIFPIPEIETE